MRVKRETGTESEVGVEWEMGAKRATLAEP